MIKRLVAYYGAGYEKILDIIDQKPANGKPLSEFAPHTVAEVLYAIEEESCLHLEDFFMRRSSLGNTGTYDDQTLQKTAQVMGKELGWNKARQKSEIEQMKKSVEIIDDLE